MHNFKELKIWQKAKYISKEVYKIAEKLPLSERFAFTTQLHRAVISIPSNIAEGSGRSSDKDFSRFMDIAISSSFEVESLLLVGIELNYFKTDEIEYLISALSELQRMMISFQNKLKMESDV